MSETTENKISPEEIEKQLDKLEEEEHADFNNWFKGYVNEAEEVEEKEEVKPVKEVEEVEQPKDDEIETVEEKKEAKEVKPIEPETTEPVEQPEQPKDDEIETVEEGSTVEEVSEQSEPKEPETNKPDDPTYSLSDIQPKTHKVKTDVAITKHRKHRSRKTELTSSLPPKEPTVIQETEHARVEIGTKKAKKLTDEELEAKLHKEVNKQVASIQDQVQEMEANGNCRKIDPIDYTPGGEKYNLFKHYLLDPLLVPKRCITKFNLNEYIASITIFNYNCFDTPNVQMQHSIPEKVIFTEKLNKLFDHQFVSSKTGDFHFADLDAQLLNFISEHKDKGTLSFEYKLIKSALGKLILNLSTDVELALCDKTRPTINSAFKQVVVKDVQYMKHLQNINGKTAMSWKAFLDTFLNTGADNLIYVHDTYRNLNIKLEKAYSTDFLIENFLGNMLKCYLPSVALNYFYAIKTIYVIARMTSLYIQLGLFKNKTQEQVMNDLFVIGAAGIIMYENKSFIYKQATRTLPSYDKPLSNETKLYILNHLLTGGQYFIIKMLEESLPSITTDLVK